MALGYRDPTAPGVCVASALSCQTLVNNDTKTIQNHQTPT